MDEQQAEQSDVDVYDALGSEDHEEPGEKKDHESAFYNLAEEQKGKDDAENQKKEDFQASKDRIVQVLQTVKKLLPSFEEYKESDPEMYEAFIGLVQSIVELAAKAQEND